jgi:hypothetical protein
MHGVLWSTKCAELMFQSFFWVKPASGLLAHGHDHLPIDAIWVCP